jgi:hypothetical protein
VSRTVLPTKNFRDLKHLESRLGNGAAETFPNLVHLPPYTLSSSQELQESHFLKALLTQNSNQTPILYSVQINPGGGPHQLLWKSLTSPLHHRLSKGLLQLFYEAHPHWRLCFSHLKSVFHASMSSFSQVLHLHLLTKFISQLIFPFDMTVGKTTTGSYIGNGFLLNRNLFSIQPAQNFEEKLYSSLCNHVQKQTQNENSCHPPVLGGLWQCVHGLCMGWPKQGACHPVSLSSLVDLLHA